MNEYCQDCEFYKMGYEHSMICTRFHVDLVIYDDTNTSTCMLKISDLSHVLTIKSEVLKIFVLDYIITHKFIKSASVAKALLSNLYGIKWTTDRYDEYVLNWTHKIKNILKEYEKQNILQLYQENNRGKTYIRKENKK